ncbi:ABC transporter substrate-binding protein [Streptomyces sp. NP-1717]|uniref:ABC transporter substrate-binding protein n=1 Tax=Streptomyces sp. NP-1717 TaxID=2704470 RepID=UPI001F5C57DC|nr:ABC transporter substrate-binding protein [Streptomyces sp. NP-1717]MCI3221976.1 ABC transporter family substrate-binding protein [Streptomyces sp. NP-1717]
MSQVGVPRGRTCSRTIRSVALLTTGVLALPLLASCSSDDERSEVPAAAQDVAPAARDRIADGGTLRWAVDTVPTTLNAFQADADATTSRVAGAVLPSLFTLDKTGRPQRNPDYLESAKIIEREPKQVVLYKLNQQAVWSDGRELGAPDFVAQWRALSGKDSAYWTARNAGYERIQKIERGANDLEVRVTFNKPYADWRGLFSPLYPKDVMGAPNTFNDGARTKLKSTAGPFQLKELDREDREVTLVRNPRWWGARPKLDSIVLSAVPRDKRAAALADGTLDLAEIDSPVAQRIKQAAKGEKGGGAGPQSGTGPQSAQPSPSQSAANDSDDEKAAEKAAEAAQASRKKANEAIAKYTKEQKGLRAYVVRKSLEPAFTQLALNGETGPLADERVRRAVARALDRQKLAEAVLKPLGLPANPPGSHLALAGQHAYADSSDALGEQDTQEAQGLLADAGWTPGGALKKEDGTKAGSEADADKKKDKNEDEEATNTDTESGAPQSGSGPESDSSSDSPSGSASGSASESASGSDSDSASDDGAYIVGDDKPGHDAPASGTGTRVIAPTFGTAFQRAVLTWRTESVDGSGVKAQDRQPGGGGMAGAYAPSGTEAPSPSSTSASASPSSSGSASTSASASATSSASALPGSLAKDGKPLTLRFVLPSGSGSEQLRTVGEKIARMLDRIGIRTEITKVADANYFKDHIASGDYDLALYSWPATAYPATDGRPIYAKPVPASDGTLLVEQNYTRVGTDHINQLFDQAASELDEKEAGDLLRQADARIWAAAGSIPLYQRPQLVAAKPSVANAGAFAFASPRYEDIGFKNTGKSGPEKTVMPESAESEATHSESAEPEATHSESAESEATDSESGEPEAERSESAEPEATHSEATHSESAEPEATDSESGEPEAEQSESAGSESDEE